MQPPADFPRRRTGRYLALGAALLLLGVFARVAVIPRYLHSWDGVQFALALDDFDVLRHRPQPPGYPLSVGLLKLVRDGCGLATAERAFPALNTFFFLAGGWLGLRLVGKLYPSAPALVPAAAALLATTPLLWFYSVTSWPYLALFFASALLLRLGLRAWRRGGVALLPLLPALAFAAGLRQELLFFSLPAMLAPFVRHRAGFRFLVSALFGLLAGALWLVPLAAVTPDYFDYARSSIAHSTHAGYWTTGNLYDFTTLGRAALDGLGLLLGAALCLRRRHLPRGGGLLILAAAPGLLFFVGRHFGRTGYLLSIWLPLFLLLLAPLAAGLARPGWRRALAWGAIVVIVLAQLATFLVLKGPHSLRELQRHDRNLGARLDGIRAHYPPGEAAILADADFRHAMYYLPEYWVIWPAQFHPGGPPGGETCFARARRESVRAFWRDDPRTGADEVFPVPRFLVFFDNDFSGVLVDRGEWRYASPGGLPALDLAGRPAVFQAGARRLILYH